ncbi:MAG: hypothetical protein IJ348_06440 [Alistipes sp.]|nr:hypothetical protein [Alistipes sp.]
MFPLTWVSFSIPLKEEGGGRGVDAQKEVLLLRGYRFRYPPRDGRGGGVGVGVKEEAFPLAWVSFSIPLTNGEKYYKKRTTLSSVWVSKTIPEIFVEL